MKKLLKKVTVLMLIAVMACTGTVVSTLVTTIEVEASSKKVSLNKSKITLAVGKTYTLKTRNTNRKATWKTSKKSVATVTSKKAKSVKINAKKVGTTIITAKIGGKTYKCKVTVVNPKISKSKLSLTVGNKSTLKVNGGTGTTKWKSANTKIATVSSKGVVTAKKAGTVKITATRNGKSLNCTVTIKAKAVAKPTPTPIPAKAPSLATSTLKVKLDGSETIKVNNASNGKITYASANQSIATVDNKGNVKGIKSGKTNVTATIIINGKTTKLNCAINVSKKHLVSEAIYETQNVLVSPATPAQPAKEAVYRTERVLVKEAVPYKPAVAGKDAVYENQIRNICHTCNEDITGFAKQHVFDNAHAGYGNQVIPVEISPAVPAQPAIPAQEAVYEDREVLVSPAQPAQPAKEAVYEDRQVLIKEAVYEHYWD